MATFVISPLNSIEFKVVDNLLPNYSNTLSYNEEFEGIVKSGFKQKFMTSETITTQFRSDYENFTAILTDSFGNSTNLPVALIKQATNQITGVVYSYYEFYVVGQTAGCYKIDVKGTKNGEPNKYFTSEWIEIVQGLKGYRYTIDGALEYEFIPGHFKIESKNNENNFNIYWGSDRISGDPFVSHVWCPGKNRNAQPGGDIEVYDNLGNLAKLQEISQRSFEMRTDIIPRYLAFKINELAGLDFFQVNDIEYVNEENGEIEYFSNFADGILTLTLTQAYVIGINSDDSGINLITDSKMASIENKVLTNTSGSQQLTISGGYSLNQITLVLESGTQANIKIGSTPAGNEIMRTETITSSNPILNIARNYVNQSDNNASFIAYIEISGVGSSATVILQTIINKQV